MARTGFIPFDEDREEQKKEEAAERRALRKDPNGVPVETTRFGELDPMDPEFASVEDFAEFLADDERSEFTHTELMCLNYRTGIMTGTIREDLEKYGFKLAHRAKEKQVRTFGTNPNTRWSSCPTHGGGGGGCIYGMADPG